MSLHQSANLAITRTDLRMRDTLPCLQSPARVQYIPRNMHTVFALLCFVVVIHWLIFPYLSGLLHWHCGNLTIAPVPAKQPWWIWINTLCEFIIDDCITTTKQSTTKPCANFLGYTVFVLLSMLSGANYPRLTPHLVVTISSDMQYIPRNMHTVLLCFALLWLWNRSEWIHVKYLSIFIRVALLALGQSLDCPSASEVSLVDMGTSVIV